MEISRSIVIDRAPQEVFALVDEPSRYPEFFIGITRWEPMTKKLKGVGAKYRVLMRIGSIEAGGVVRVVERRKPKLIRWEAEQGIHQSGRWILEPSDEGTRLSLEVDFDLSGGPVGALVARMTGRIVRRNMWATLLAARRILESV
jgi:ribosome-associated toxin RatA of RatAB toxin-antitoxin module